MLTAAGLPTTPTGEKHFIYLFGEFMRQTGQVLSRLAHALIEITGATSELLQRATLPIGRLIDLACCRSIPRVVKIA